MLLSFVSSIQQWCSQAENAERTKAKDKSKIKRCWCKGTETAVERAFG